MRIIITLLILISSVLNAVAQGTLLEDTVVLHLTIEDINELLSQNGIPEGVLATDYEVDVHRVVYNTPDPHGQITGASGLIFIPSNDTCPMPMMAYLHGTKIHKEETFYFLQGEWTLGAISATSGYAVVMPDYLGLGASPGIHFYQHEELDAKASIDIMCCVVSRRPFGDGPT